MESTEQNSITKVLMVPWLAHGHISPFLELAKKLTTKNFEIYLCSTPINLKSIQNKITTTAHSLSIKLIPLHIPPSPELPPHHHTTNGLPLHLLNTLKMVFQTAGPDFSKIVDKLRPDLIIYDAMEPWAPAIAAEYKIPAVQFLTSGAAVFSFGIHMFEKPGVEFPFTELQRMAVIGERGLVVEGWAPQAQILEHSSTVGFVSHCGWSSIMESLKFGVPIIAMPMNHDQPFNAKLLEEVGVGVEVQGYDNKSRIHRENIAQVIRKVVKDQSGADIRSKAREFSYMIAKKGEEDIDAVAQELRQLSNEAKFLKD